MLEVERVVVRFGSRTVLDGVSLTVQPGEIVALTGASGSGKSTLLRVIAGLQAVDGGSVRWSGADLSIVAPHRRGFGFVFQDEQLFPHLSVAGNIEFGLRMDKVAKAARSKRVAQLLELVGLEGFEKRAVDDLSGGEAKRVALARALAPEPKLLLLDEPLTGLDADLHDRLVVDVRRILQQTATTAIHVTHDHDEAITLADRVLSLHECLAPGAWSGRQVAAVSAVDEATAGDAPSALDHRPDAEIPVIGRPHVDVIEIPTRATHPLRLRVLRRNTPSIDPRYPQDDDPGTFHLGALYDGRLVGTSTWAKQSFDGEPGTLAHRLRGMAIEDGLQGSGVGAALVNAGIARAAALGSTIVWASARDAVLGFYERQGFEATGDGYIDAATALPHHDIIRRL